MKNKILNIPNVLTIIRFFLVPVAVIFIFADFPYSNLWAAGVVVVAYNYRRPGRIHCPSQTHCDGFWETDGSGGG